MGMSSGLNSQELKALSVPSSLRFLLSVEGDIMLCVNRVNHRKPFTIRFSILGNTFQKLLGLCAERFGLACAHHDDHSVISGDAVIPPLRYIDYLPGGLYAEEVLECLGVRPPTSPRRSGKSGHEFVASFTDYSEYRTDASLADVHGAGFCLTLDYGLSTANHSHLVEIRFHKGFTVEEALREFEEFSGWSTFDLRFDNPGDKHAGGILVMPSIQDACDLFEKYEDEDSDDEGELLPFILRPVAPLTSVPSVEDSAIKKLRDQHWGEIEKFWDRFPRWKNCVVVTNLYDSASLEETLAFFEGLNIVSSSLVEDNSPARRRRVFVTFATADEAKKALLLDGRSTKGKTLRVQVSPPYVDESRRGRVVDTQTGSVSNTPLQKPEAAGPTMSSSPYAQGKRDASSGAAFDATFLSGKEKSVRKNGEDKKWSPVAFTDNTSPHVTSASAPVAVSAGGALGDAAAAMGAGGQKATSMSSQPARSPSLTGSTMNVSAKEFFPSATFHVNSPLPSFYPSPLPLPFAEECHTLPPAYIAHAVQPVVAIPSLCSSHRSLKVGSAPPPYTPPHTAPPPYSVAAAQAMHIVSHPPLPPPSPSM